MPKELSMIDTAVGIMSKEKRSFELYDLFDRVAEEMNLSEEEQQSHLPKFYSDLTTSAKFIYVGDNKWNLKANEKVELWDKDGSFYKEYTVVELPEEYKVDPYAQTKPKPKAKPKPKPEPVVEEPVQVVPEEIEVVVEEPVQEEPTEVVVDPVVKPLDLEETPAFDAAPDEEYDEDEVFEDYDDFDEEKYNEYMDNYEDQYDD